VAPAIPPERHETPVASANWIHGERKQAERLCTRLKEWRAIATYYEEIAVSFGASSALPILTASSDDMP
jgi:transposase